MIYEISVKDIKENLGYINIIDIRDRKETLYGMVPTAINIEETLLVNRPDLYIHRDLIYYVYCNTGEKSKEVCEKLYNMGYNIHNITGGYMKWISL